MKTGTGMSCGLPSARIDQPRSSSIKPIDQIAADANTRLFNFQSSQIQILPEAMDTAAVRSSLEASNDGDDHRLSGCPGSPKQDNSIIEYRHRKNAN